MSTPQTVTVAGIDVGGPAKGFHAVALRDGIYLDHLSCRYPQELLTWCLKHSVRCIAIDAPSEWRRGRTLRQAEQDLMSEGIRCFPTPERDEAIGHPTGWYDWMIEGEKLYRKVQARYPLLDRPRLPARHRRSIETFPHAITRAFLGPGAKAQNKLTDRQAILEHQGTRMPRKLLADQDTIDAALCALTAHFLATRQACRFFGEPETGYIAVPMPD